MSLEQITDHEAQAEARLADQFKDKTKILALVDAFAAQVQDVEDALFGLIDGRTVGGATGSTLDLIGAQVGRSRPSGASDDTYRALIYAQILINTGHTTTEDVLALLAQLGADDVVLQEPGLASLRLSIVGELLIDGSDLRDTLEAATAPVALDLSLYEGSGFPFGFDGDADAAGFGVGEISEAL